MYGRENIGKTSMIMEFCREKLFSYYLARPCSELEQLKLYGRRTQNYHYRPVMVSIMNEIHNFSHKQLTVFYNIMKFIDDQNEL